LEWEIYSRKNSNLSICFWGKSSSLLLLLLLPVFRKLLQAFSRAYAMVACLFVGKQVTSVEEL